MKNNLKEALAPSAAKKPRLALASSSAASASTSSASASSADRQTVQARLVMGRHVNLFAMGR